MKKILIAALMVANAAAAMAGDSDALKAILKAKDYTEAKSLVTSSLGSLANSEEKAKAYNHLVDLAMDKVGAVLGVMSSNAMAEQTGSGKVEAYDTLGFYQAMLHAVTDAAECDKYDNMPNEKGKVKVKFHKANSDRLWNMRAHLINGGIFFQEKGDLANAYKFLSTYVDSNQYPLFSEQNTAGDENITNMAYYAAVFAYQNQDMANVEKYCDIAMKDPEKASDAMSLKMAALQSNLHTRADSLAFAEKLEGIYANDPNNEVVFGMLITTYSSLGENAKMESLFDKKLATDPNNFTVWAVRGQNAMIAQNLEEAITDFKKALQTQPNNAQVRTYLGACLLDRAAQAEDRAAGRTGRVSPQAMEQIRPIFEEARENLEMAKQLDPNREQANWAYPLYRCYYSLYGEDDARTKAAEADTH
ncbi:MAG: hypothetical protein IKX22_10160 [Prevotella sp.]|nr:hypothetical protein [Prevotella sp.]